MPETRLWFGSALLPEGWADNVRLTLADGKILRAEAGVVAAASEERHAVVLPGLADVHSHAFQRGMAGLAERRGPEGDNFWTWREVMYRFLDRLTPEDVEAIAAEAYAEMLETGFTRVGEFHYLHHAPDGAPYANRAEMAERIAAAAVQTGIGLTLLPVFYAHANFGGLPPAPGQRRFISNIDGFAALMDDSRRATATLDNARLGVAPHSLRAVTPDELHAIIAMVEGGPIHIHAAEQTKEVEDCLAWSGARPVAWLLDHAAVDLRWCLVHATHLTAAEVGRLAA
ncbi:MAG: formimidoylglutamate deiminase, partial [Alphaproteobacteria bacterium]|nr:formimidoylglutamate deiminase [Alphaproteobacteria bacterium]